MQQLKRKSVFLLALLSIFLPNARSQKFPFAIHYTVANGLPGNSVYRMILDQQGFIWLGTDAGVSRFNGQSFQNYTIQDGLSDNEIVNVKEDSQGRVWFLGLNGTVSYFFKNKIINSSSNPFLKQIYTGTPFLNLIEDANHRLWFISQTECLMVTGDSVKSFSTEEFPASGFLFDSKGKLIIPSTATLSGSILDQGSFKKFSGRYAYTARGAFQKLADGNVLFASKEGIVFMQDSIQKLLLRLTKQINELRQYSLYFQNKQNLWLATSGGLFLFNLEQPQKVQHFLTDHVTGNILKDRQGNLWVSTLDDGVFMKPAWQTMGTSASTAITGASLVACYDNGHQLVATQKGGLLELYGEEKINILLPAKAVMQARITHLETVGNKALVATDDHLYVVESQKKSAYEIYMNTAAGKQPLQAIKSITSNKGHAFITMNYGICEVDLTQSIADLTSSVANKILTSEPRLFTATQTHDGKLWFANVSGLNSLEHKNITPIVLAEPSLTSRINAIQEIAADTLLLATNGAGILLFTHGKIIQHLDAKDGLKSSFCKRVLQHGQTIFVLTPSCLSMIQLRNGCLSVIKNIPNFHFSQGKKLNDFSLRKNDLFIASAEGVLQVPVHVLNTFVLPPQLISLGLVIKNQALAAITDTALDHDQNDIQLHYTALEFQWPQDVLFRYRLNPDLGWTETQQSQMEFPALSPGDYQMEVQARVQNSSWCQPIFYHVVVHEPFWNSWPFKLIVVFVSLGLIWALVQYRIKTYRRAVQAKMETDKQLADLEQQALQGMMNPHFIFNVINSIQHFMNLNDNKSANLYLSDFGKLIRNNLRLTQKKSISLEEEIQYLQQYIHFEQLRFKEKLQVSLLVDPSLDPFEIELPAMMIQPFVENAIWHGILPIEQQGLIQIEIRQFNHQTLEILITDNGKGIAPALIGSAQEWKGEQGRGLSITIQRLKLIAQAYQQAFVLSFERPFQENSNKGTRVRMHLPISR